jgi:hypothetical protein
VRGPQLIPQLLELQRRVVSAVGPQEGDHFAEHTDGFASALRDLLDEISHKVGEAGPIGIPMNQDLGQRSLGIERDHLTWMYRSGPIL